MTYQEQKEIFHIKVVGIGSLVIDIGNCFIASNLIPGSSYWK